MGLLGAILFVARDKLRQRHLRVAQRQRREQQIRREQARPTAIDFANLGNRLRLLVSPPSAPQLGPGPIVQRAPPSPPFDHHDARNVGVTPAPRLRYRHRRLRRPTSVAAPPATRMQLMRHARVMGALPPYAPAQNPTRVTTISQNMPSGFVEAPVVGIADSNSSRQLYALAQSVGQLLERGTDACGRGHNSRAFRGTRSGRAAWNARVRQALVMDCQGAGRCHATDTRAEAASFHPTGWRLPLCPACTSCVSIVWSTHHSGFHALARDWSAAGKAHMRFRVLWRCT